MTPETLSVACLAENYWGTAIAKELTLRRPIMTQPIERARGSEGEPVEIKVFVTESQNSGIVLRCHVMIELPSEPIWKKV